MPPRIPEANKVAPSSTHLAQSRRPRAVLEFGRAACCSGADSLLFSALFFPPMDVKTGHFGKFVCPVSYLYDMYLHKEEMEKI
ncbi:hypothetical protein Taro_007336 [Colocasia esculenta]|uniref:Uncharacterized protein n=1 Tax=Colocasia esculenta TaxID=4460 RepID=A0A843U045_COLES|nr:hypothetical protein [Colocasia esculenta]